MKTITGFARAMLKLPGHRVEHAKKGKDGGIEVHVVPDRRYALLCGECGARAAFHSTGPTRRYAHLPFWHLSTSIILAVRRVRCEPCGLTEERLRWADGQGRMTHEMSAELARLAKIMPWPRVAEEHGVPLAMVERAVRTAAPAP